MDVQQTWGGGLFAAEPYSDLNERPASSTVETA